MKIEAPWTKIQVLDLINYQVSGRFHPYTCGGGGGEHSGVRLLPTPNGWVCPVQTCTYRQSWAYGPLPDKEPPI